MRPFAHLLLALIVALSSVTMAEARHQPRAVGAVALCTDLGAVAVAVDAQGRPVAPRHLCPDCTPAQAALQAGPVPLPGPALRLVAVAPAGPSAPARPAGAPLRRHARAPPAAV